MSKVNSMVDDLENANEPDGSVNQHNRPAAVRLPSAAPSISTSSRISPQPSISLPVFLSMPAAISCLRTSAHAAMQPVG